MVAGKIYRRHKCNQCKNAYNNSRRAERQAWLTEYKKTRTCERCGFSDFRALQFHHTGEDPKAANVADLVSDALSLAMIQREIVKCVVLCANCHRIEHHPDAEA